MSRYGVPSLPTDDVVEIGSRAPDGPAMYCLWLLPPGPPVLDLLLGLIPRDAVALLDAAHELVALAVDDREVVIGQLAPALLDLAGELLPIAGDLIPIHCVLHCERGPENALCSS